MKYLLIILNFFESPSLYSQRDYEKHILFDEVKSKYESKVGNKCNTFKVHFNDKEAKGRTDFLNKDFSTKLFNQYNSIKYWYCNASNDENKRIHIEIVSINFRSGANKKAAIRKIKSTQRTNFKVKQLTKFKLKDSKNELLIVYSETLGSSTISAFMEHL